MSTTAISKPIFQEVDGTVILPLTFIKEYSYNQFAYRNTMILSTLRKLSNLIEKTLKILRTLNGTLCPYVSDTYKFTLTL